MAVRLPREEVVVGDLAVYAGWVAVAGALVFGGLVFVLGVELLPMSVGLAVLGATWIVHGQHTRRRPGRYVAVTADGIRLEPEGTEHTLDALGPLTVLKWSFSRADAGGVAVEVQRATVRSAALDLELFQTLEEADGEAWITRFEAATRGEATTPPTPMDLALETPSSGAKGAALGATLAAVVGLVVGYATAEPIWATGVGAGVLVMGATATWAALARRGAARAVGVLGGLGLLARPFVHPVIIDVVGGHHVPGPFDEPHLGFFVGGLIALVYSAAGTRPPGPAM